jgi:purine-binding chemotaxis protein CheW
MSTSLVKTTTELFTTFHVGHNLFGIEVMKVQEVTGTPLILAVPLAPEFVKGLINLRGQLATALGLRELFGSHSKDIQNQMSVVCRVEGNLVSLMVDSIGDVFEAETKNFESAPDTIPDAVKQYVKGIYKMDGALLSVLDLDLLAKVFTPLIENNDNRI